MINKKILLALLPLLFSSQAIADEVVHQTYEIAIKNNHFANLRNFTTEPWFGSTKCEIQLDRDIVKPGETAYGKFITDAEIKCGIIWTTMSLVDENTLTYKQEIVFDHRTVQKYCDSCDVKRTNKDIVIVQEMIKAT